MVEAYRDPFQEQSDAEVPLHIGEQPAEVIEIQGSDGQIYLAGRRVEVDYGAPKML